MTSILPRTKRGRVLICDDSEQKYQELSAFLEDEGFTCDPRVGDMPDVLRALAAAQSSGDWYDLVFLDIDLGDDLPTGIDIYRCACRDYPHETYVIYTSQDVRSFHIQVNELMYDDVAVIVLHELREKRNLGLYLHRLIQAADPDTVFLVRGRNHGKNEQLRSTLSSEFGIRTIDWEDARSAAGTTPSIMETVRKGITMSHATIVLFTDDDAAELRTELVEDGDIEAQPSYRLGQRRQARPNVFIEAGIALGMRPRRTIFVTWPDDVHRFQMPTDLAGLTEDCRFEDTPAGVARLRRRLAALRCRLKPAPT